MRIIIEAPFTMKDFIKFGIFMREQWRHRKDLCFILVTHGFGDLSSEECMSIFKEVFTSDDKDWHEGKMTKKVVDEFIRKVIGRSYEEK